jgi:nucleoside-diphosphate-sugar epimerase
MPKKTTYSCSHYFPALPVVLISGVSGAMGSVLAKALNGQYQVVGIDRYCREDLTADCIPIDLTSDEAVARAFQEIRENYGDHITSVIHLAAYYDFSGEESPLYQQVNVEGTRRLLRALQEFQVDQFVYSSTMLVHKATQPGIAITEESPLEAHWAYPISKLKTEQVITAEHGNIPYVLLRIAGLYDDRGGVPTLTHQIKRIYERSFKSRFFAGETSHGQSYVHIEDLIKAFVQVIERRNRLPDDCKILIGEPMAMSYQALQNELGRLIHGESWETLPVPKPLAKTETWVEEKVDAAAAKITNDHEPPFIRSFMIDRADDHYEIDISQARRLLDWQPKHTLRDTLPRIIAALKDDPLAWYQENGLTPAP